MSRGNKNEDENCHPDVLSPLTFNLSPYHLPTSPIEEEHAEEDEQEVEGFAAEVLLAEEQGTAEERHQHAATTHHGDDGDERVALLEGGEVGKVGRTEEKRDEGYGPRPMERGALLALGVP